MNIMKTNMLLLDNRIKKDEGDNTTVVSAPVPQTTQPEAGMKALAFMGIKNLMENPELAKEVGVADEGTLPEEKEDGKDAKSYVAPYSSNVAFQGGFKQKAGIMAIAALATLGAANLQSCKEPEGDTVIQVQKVEIDNSEVVQMLSMLYSLFGDKLDALIAQLGLTNQEVEELKAQLLAWQTEANNRWANLELLLTEMFNKMAAIGDDVKEGNALKEVMIALLEQNNTQNKMSHDEIVEYINKLIEEVRNGNKTAQEAMKELLAKIDLVNLNLSTISQQIKDAMETFNEFKAQAIAMAQKILENQNATQAQINVLINQNNGMIQQNNIIIGQLTSLYNLINSKFDKINTDMNKGFNTLEAIAEAIGMKIGDLQSLLAQIGLSINDLKNKSVQEILALLKAHIAQLNDTNSKLDEINNNVENGVTSGTEAAQEIIDLLNDIKGKLAELNANFVNFMNEYKNDKKQELALLRGLWANGQLQTSILARQTQYLASMDAKLKNLEAITNNIYAATQDDTKFNALMEELRNIASKQGIDYDRLKEMFDAMGIRIEDAINMNASQLAQVIKNFQNTYIKTEKEQTELLKQNNQKLDCIACLLKKQNNNNAGVINAIVNLTNAVNSGKEDLTAELKALQAQLDALIAKVEQVLKSMNANFERVHNALCSMNKSLCDIKNNVKNIGSQINLLIAYAKNAEKQRADLLAAVNSLKAKMDELKAIAGQGLTAEEFDRILSEHDAANYAKYKELIENLNINMPDFNTKPIEDLLAAMNDKLDKFQQTTNSLLLDILNRIKAMDKSAPDYNEKLDRIIELLEGFNFNCCCQSDCDHNQDVHEGVIDILS